MFSKELQEQNYRQMLANMDEMVDKVGHMVMGVGADPALGDPTFAYTIGLARKGLPDIVTFGIPWASAHAILHLAAEALEKRFKAMWPFDFLPSVDRIFGNDQVATFGRVETEEAYRDWMVQAHAYYHRHGLEPVGAVQLFWPDKRGLTLLDEGYDYKFRQLQDRITPHGMGTKPVKPKVH